MYSIIVDIYSVLWHCRLGVGNGIWCVENPAFTIPKDSPLETWPNVE